MDSKLSFLLLLIYLAVLTKGDDRNYVLKRIIHKINLKSTLPNANLTAIQDFDFQMVKVQPFDDEDCKFDIVNERGNVYFLASVRKPMILKLNLYFNTSFNNKIDMKKIKKRFEVANDKWERVNVFEFKIHNSIEEILKSEKSILDQFESQIWKPKSCKSCLSIVQIRPDQDSFVIAVGSPEKHNDQLEEFCFLNQVPGDFLRKLNLNIITSGPKCYTIPLSPLNKIQGSLPEYPVNAIANVGAKNITMTRYSQFTQF